MHRFNLLLNNRAAASGVVGQTQIIKQKTCDDAQFAHHRRDLFSGSSSHCDRNATKCANILRPASAADAALVLVPSVGVIQDSMHGFDRPVTAVVTQQGLSIGLIGTQ